MPESATDLELILFHHKRVKGSKTGGWKGQKVWPYLFSRCRKLPLQALMLPKELLVFLLERFEACCQLLY